MDLNTQKSREMIDEETIVKMAQHDPAHFKPLYEAHFKKIYLFVFHKLYDKELAADITSQVFLKALSSIGDSIKPQVTLR